MLLIEIESVEEIKSSKMTWRNQNQLIMPTCKLLFLILYLRFKNLSLIASTQLEEKDIQHFLLTNNILKWSID